jgi:hypothetical protein
VFPQDIADGLPVISEQRLTPMMEGLVGLLRRMSGIGGDDLCEVVHRILALIPEKEEDANSPVRPDRAGDVVQGQGPPQPVRGSLGIR